MLKRLELKNFESHKHTILENLSDGFNLIRGASMAGKTAMVRALKLAAYNEFDPKSLRVGESKCEVIVETEKGTVKVVRGPKVNAWEVTPVGQPTLCFDKVGKQIIPEAARIIGLNIIRLGDADIPVNIMDQLESHFMLASVGGEDASGSLRAQVIDEISGLSGIEGVIKDVSLDNHRFGREIKEVEVSMEEVCKQLHNAEELKEEEETLDVAEQSLAHREECVKTQGEVKSLLDDWSANKAEADTVKGELAQMPDLDMARAGLETADKLLARLEKAKVVWDDATTVRQKVKAVHGTLGRIPDTDKVLELSKKAREQMDAASAMRKTIDEYNSVSEKIDTTAERVAKIGETDKAVELLGHAKTHRDNAQNAKKLLDEMTAAGMMLAKTNALIVKCETELAAAEAEKNAILETVKVCPLTLGPVSPECIQKAREK